MSENFTESDNDNHSDSVTQKEKNLRLIYLSLVAVSTVAGNLLVLLAILRFKSLRRATNVMLGSLALADFLVGTVTVPLYILWMTSPGIFDTSIFMCGLVLLSCLLVVTASQISLLILSVEQYFAVCHPFLHRNALIHHPRLHTIAVVSTWALSLTTTALSLLAFDTRAKSCSYYGVFNKTFLFVASIAGVICPFFLIISLNIKVLYAVRAHDKRRQTLGVRSKNFRGASTSSNFSSNSDDVIDSIGVIETSASQNTFSSQVMDTKCKPKFTSDRAKEGILKKKGTALVRFINSLFQCKKTKFRKKSYKLRCANRGSSLDDGVANKNIYVVGTKRNFYGESISTQSISMNTFSGNSQTIQSIIPNQDVEDESGYVKTEEQEQGPGNFSNISSCETSFLNTKNVNNNITVGNSPLEVETMSNRETEPVDSELIQGNSVYLSDISKDDIDVESDFGRKHKDKSKGAEKRKQFKSRSRSFDGERLKRGSQERYLRKAYSLSGDHENSPNSCDLSLMKSTSLSSNFISRKRESGSGREVSSRVTSRVANMVALVCASFILAWCPFFVVVLFNTFCGGCNLTYFLNAVIIVAFTKSGTNPVVYALCHVAFRRAYSKILTPLCRMRKLRRDTGLR